MKTSEMEPMIKELGFAMLEEKLEHNEVHYFICAEHTHEVGDETYGNLIVFDKDGKAYVAHAAVWDTDYGSFRIYRDDQSKKLFINGNILKRQKDLDLHVH